MQWPLKIVRVSGHSMQPLITDGKFILVYQWAYKNKKPQIGDVVIFRESGSLWCKRVIGEIRGGYLLRGDNRSDTTDPGSVSPKQILGKVLFL